MKLSLYIFITVLLCMGLLAAGCTQSDQNTDVATEASSITITDSARRTVTMDQPIERVAILDNGTIEILKALGVMDRLVGNHSANVGNPLYPEVQEMPVVATYAEVNYEKLAEVRPQVVFSSVRAHGIVDEQEHLQGFNIKDVKLNLRNPELIKDEVLLLGKIFNKEEKAQELVDFYNQYKQLIASRVEQVRPEDRLTVFVEYHAGDFHTGGPSSRFYEQTILAGAVNIASSLSEEPQVSAEWVTEQNPDVIIREAKFLLPFYWVQASLDFQLAALRTVFKNAGERCGQDYGSRVQPKCIFHSKLLGIYGCQGF